MSKGGCLMISFSFGSFLFAENGKWPSLFGDDKEWCRLKGREQLAPNNWSQLHEHEPG